MERREFITTTVKAALGVALVGSVAGCGLLHDDHIDVCTLDALRQDGHRVLDFNDEAVFVGLDAQGQPYALSLICTHKQCTVRFKPDLGEFRCPCHQGRYDAQGRVLAGKPPRPLARLGVRIENGVVQVWAEPEAETPV